MFTYGHSPLVVLSRTWVQHYCLHMIAREPYGYIQDRK